MAASIGIGIVCGVLCSCIGFPWWMVVITAGVSSFLFNSYFCYKIHDKYGTSWGYIIYTIISNTLLSISTAAFFYGITNMRLNKAEFLKGKPWYEMDEQTANERLIDLQSGPNKLYCPPEGGMYATGHDLIVNNFARHKAGFCAYLTGKSMLFCSTITFPFLFFNGMVSSAVLSINSRQKNENSDQKNENFAKLSDSIKNLTQGKTLVLTQNYTYSGVSDLINIRITTNNITIDGKGCTINAKHITNIFNITGSNITIKNLILSNANDTNGAITNNGELLLDNVTFINNTGNYGGAVTNNNKITIINSTFTNKNNGIDIYNSKNGQLTLIKNKSTDKNKKISICNKGRIV